MKQNILLTKPTVLAYVKEVDSLDQFQKTKIFLANSNNLGNSQLIRAKFSSLIVLIKVCAKALFEILVKVKVK